jgi:hypothetical protein
MTTLTIDEAIQLVPAIGATAPDHKVSNSYQFVSSRDILERVHQDGWRITNASSQGQKESAQHRVTLVHSSDLKALTTDNPEGVLRMEMFNSHNRTKRLMFAVGYFRLVCSNGLIVASGPAETIRTKHRFSGDKLEAIMSQVADISNRFPVINESITGFKDRNLTDEEMEAFARYAIQGRYNYRQELPKLAKQESFVERVLSVRRDADQGNSTWAVYNRVQENIIRGVDGISSPIKSYSDNIRVNQLLWKGAETTLSHEKQDLKTALFNLLVKDGKKGKISA